MVKKELSSLADIVIISFVFANFKTLPKSIKFKPNVVFLSQRYSSKPSSFILSDTKET